MKKSGYALLLVFGVAAFLAGTWYGERRPVESATPTALSSATESSAAPRPELAGTVTLSADQQQALDLRVDIVERKPAIRTVRLSGRVAPDETRVYKINAPLDGAFREVAPVSTGSQVKKDQWLASFFALETRVPAQALLSALDVVERALRAGDTTAQVKIAETSTQLSVERLKNIGMSAAQIEEIKRTREVPLLVKINSPVDGFVLARNVSPEQKFERGAEWYRIADLHRVWILADVFSHEGRHVRAGARAKVSLPDGSVTIAARVAEVLPQFDPASRTLKVRLEADNPRYVLRPDMLVDVEVTVDLPATISVPVDAVLDSGLEKVVFVETRDGSFGPRRVETGWRFGDRVEIVDGLAPGERIVTSATFLLDSESRMRSSAGGAPHGAHGTHGAHGNGAVQRGQSAPAVSAERAEHGDDGAHGGHGAHGGGHGH